MSADVLPGMPDLPPIAPKVPGLSAGRRLTERQARDVREGRHPLTGGKLHEQADKTAKAGDPKDRLFRCGSCVHRVLERHNDGTYPKCDLSTITFGAATDVRAWWPACPKWEETGSLAPPESRQPPAAAPTSVPEPAPLFVAWDRVEQRVEPLNRGA